MIMWACLLTCVSYWLGNAGVLECPVVVVGVKHLIVVLENGHAGDGVGEEVRLGVGLLLSHVHCYRLGLTQAGRAAAEYEQYCM